MNHDYISAQPQAPRAPVAQVISLDELHSEDSNGSQDAAAVVLGEANPLHGVRTTLQVCVGEVDITVGDLVNAKEHQVLVLDRAVDQAVDLLLGGKIVARGQLVAVDGKFGLRITELPVPLKV
ncbi:MAG: surface presentation of antigen protein [Ramlibacter sp.]|nr:surface presentation of antigen protein [Ramlibacter sp.]